jgi:hypothetical protein
LNYKAKQKQCYNMSGCKETNDFFFLKKKEKKKGINDESKT